MIGKDEIVSASELLVLRTAAHLGVEQFNEANRLEKENAGLLRRLERIREAVQKFGDYNGVFGIADEQTWSEIERANALYTILHDDNLFPMPDDRTEEEA